MNDRLLKRMILEAIQETLNEGKSTELLEKAEGFKKEFGSFDKFCSDLKEEHMQHRSSQQGGSDVLPQKPHKGSRWEKEDTETYKNDLKSDKEKHERGRGEMALDTRYSNARKLCRD